METLDNPGPRGHETMTPVDLPAEDIVVDTVDAFASLMTRWHAGRMNDLHHMLKIPEGMTVTIKDDKTGEDEEFVLTGDLRKAFRIGVYSAIGLFEKLPFGTIMDDSDTPSEASNEPVQSDESSAN